MPNNNKPAKKNRLSRNDIILKLYWIEKEQKESDPLIQNWVEEILLNDHLKLVKKLSEGIFDISLPSKKIVSYFHSLKLLLIIAEEQTLEQLSQNDDLELRLITYIRDSEKEEICQDALFILSSIFVNADKLKDFYTQSFLIGIFDLLNMIEDDSNFKAAVKILIEINSIYNSGTVNMFLKVYHIHPNARVFNEVLLRLINTEENKTKLMKMFLCLSNIFAQEQNNVLYSTDIETFIDIVLCKLETTYTDELKAFIIDAVEKVVYYPEYYKSMYKIDDIIELFEDYVNNESQSEAIKKKAKNVLDFIHYNLNKINKENIQHIQDQFQIKLIDDKKTEIIV